MKLFSPPRNKFFIKTMKPFFVKKKSHKIFFTSPFKKLNENFFSCFLFYFFKNRLLKYVFIGCLIKLFFYKIIFIKY